MKSAQTSAMFKTARVKRCYNDILDPNQKLEPRFTSYIVLTVDGIVFTGMLISESADAIVLRQPEGKERTIAHNDIEELRASSKSVMPEGIEQDISVQQMADLLEYLKSHSAGPGRRDTSPSLVN